MTVNFSWKVFFFFPFQQKKKLKMSISWAEKFFLIFLHLYPLVTNYEIALFSNVVSLSCEVVFAKSEKKKIASLPPFFRTSVTFSFHFLITFVPSSCSDEWTWKLHFYYEIIILLKKLIIDFFVNIAKVVPRKKSLKTGRFLLFFA